MTGRWWLPADMRAFAVVMGVVFGAMALPALLVGRVAPLDGPFTGRPVPPPDGDASSSLTKGPFTFECQNRPSGPPIIVVKRSDGEVTGAWELALAPDAESAKLTSCTLDSASNRFRGGYSVHGRANWTYGREAAFFHFDGNGALENFYLDW